MDPQATVNFARLVMTQAQAAKKILKVIYDKDNWCQYGKALDGRGRECSPISPNAARWSFLGAIYRARLTKDEALSIRILCETNKFTVEAFSQSTDYELIIKLLKDTGKDLGKKTQLYEDCCALATRLASTPQPSTAAAVHLGTTASDPASSEPAPQASS
jgi:hypothetical protein